MQDYRKKTRSTVKMLLVTMIALVIMTIVYWGIGSSWGSVSFKKVSIVGNSGQIMGATEIIPKGVNMDNPAPAFITHHGYGGQGAGEYSFGLELARRGYVVILMDGPSTGESNISADDYAYDGYMMESWIDYALSQKFITQVGISGMSMGSRNVATVLGDGYADRLSCAIDVVAAAFFPMFPQWSEMGGCDIAFIGDDADWLDSINFGYDVSRTDSDDRLKIIREYTKIPDAQFGTVYGDFENSAFYANVVRGIHSHIFISSEALTNLIDFIEASMPSGTSLASNDLLTKPFYICGFICCVLLVMMCAQIASLLAGSKQFNKTIVTELPAYQPIEKKKRIIGVVLDLVVPFVLLFVITPLFPALPTDVPEGFNWIFRSTFINAVVFWFFACSVFGLIVILLTRRNKAQKNESSVQDAKTNTKETRTRIINGFIIGTITTVIAFVWVDAVVKITGLHYAASDFAVMTRMTPQRFIRALPYVVIFLFNCVIMNINIAGSRRLPDSGHETRDLIRDMVYNAVISALPLTLMLLLTVGSAYMFGDGSVLINPSLFSQAMTSGTGFPFYVASGAAVSTYLYRKTGNIYTGIVTSAFILGFFPLAGAYLIG